MPRASKNKLEKEITLQLESHFIRFIAKLNSKNDIEKFLQQFLTREEKLMFIKRLMIYLMIDLNYKTSEISSLLKISRETVRSHRQRWSKSENRYKQIIKSISKNKDNKRLWSKIGKIIEGANTLLKINADMNSRAKIYKGKFSD